MVQILRKQNRMSLLRAFMPSVLLSFECSSRASAWCLFLHMTRVRVRMPMGVAWTTFVRWRTMIMTILFLFWWFVLVSKGWRCYIFINSSLFLKQGKENKLIRMSFQYLRGHLIMQYRWFLEPKQYSVVMANSTGTKRAVHR